MHLHGWLPTLQFGLDQPPKLAHRLSAELSGILILTRHKAAAEYLKDMIKKRAFWQRTWWGIASGRLQSGTISMPLAYEKLRNKSQDVSKPRREDDGGLPAITEYRTVRSSQLAGGVSLVEFNPYSGRHHQVRAHCAFGLGAPLVGDPLYYDLSNYRLNGDGSLSDVPLYPPDQKKERQQVLGAQPQLQLHSRQMMIKTFAGKSVLITAPVPPHMLAVMKHFGWGTYARQVDRESALHNPWRADLDPHVTAFLEEHRASESQGDVYE